MLGPRDQRDQHDLYATTTTTHNRRKAMSSIDTFSEMERVAHARWVQHVAEKLLVKSGVEFRKADPTARATMIAEAFAAAEAFVAEANRRFEAARSPRRRLRAV
jgi:hypothetical protein